MEHKPGGKLRDGFTTGTCAAAAAKAAAVLLCRQEAGEEAQEDRHLHLEFMTPAGISASLDAEVVAYQPNKVCCRVRKDAGDDPDVTNQVWILAEVEWLDQEQWEKEQESGAGSGYQLEEYPFCYLTGGQGIGIATKPGLSCPPGFYAINPVPRQMIIEAVSGVFREAGIKRHVIVRILVPEGEVLAAKTFNPKLGITGGISIIGTTGLVRPMSEEALIDTVRLELHMKAAAGRNTVFIVPGNYGETFLYEKLGIPPGESVTCSNFIADAVEMAVQEGIGRLLLTGHIGKLIKVAGGVRNTHSRYGDRRMEILAAIAEHYSRDLAAVIEGANTTEEAIGILNGYGADGLLNVRSAEDAKGAESLGECVLNDVAAAVKQQAEVWGNGRLQVEVVTFSSAYGILGKTSWVLSWVADWHNEQEEAT